MKIICVEKNYFNDVITTDTPVSKVPIIYHKPSTALARKGVAMPFPENIEELSFQTEIVLRICKNGKRIRPRNAFQFIDKWTVGINFTDANLFAKLQSKGLPWELARAFDNSSAAGDFRPLERYSQTKDASFSMFCNGDKVQEGRSSNLILKFETLIAYISEYFTLQIGDLIFTGTPIPYGDTVYPGSKLEGYLNNELLLDLYIR